MQRQFHWILLVVFVCLGTLSGDAQVSTAQLGGSVTDPQNAVIANADVRAVSTSQGTNTETKTNRAGQFTFPALLPGTYKLFVQADGFETLAAENITLNVGDKRQMALQLKVGSSSQSVTVDGRGLTINTVDASVSTVVDRKFVENMPLNGRSFQSLILLAPGVLTTSPQVGTSAGVSGEFSVNGQRTDGNMYSIDGISANSGVVALGSGAGNAGGLSSFSSFGGTQAITSIDALQEFRISTSTYSAESGRQPGAQIGFETRSGTNEFHGTAFDYLRNDALDANNWFNDHSTPIIAKPAELQNDYGGVLGGPVMVPGLYSGKNHAFFFFSYEGLRLTQPQAASIYYVPSNGMYNTGTYSNPLYKNLRANAAAAVQPILNSFPKPNCSIAQDSQCVDYGDGLSPWILSTSLPSNLDAISIRGDYRTASWLKAFFRYADTTSSSVVSESTYATILDYKTQIFSFGGDSAISPSVANQLRLGYTTTRAIRTSKGVTLDGAVPVDLMALQGLPSSGSLSQVGFNFPSGESAEASQFHAGAPLHQWNLVDTVSWSRGTHVIHAGIDYRRTVSYLNTPGISEFPLNEYIYNTAAGVLTNVTQLGLIETAAEQDPEFTNFSAFAQDEWHVNSRVSLSLGLRWELNPPPSVIKGAPAYTVDGSFNNPASLAIAPLGTPLYKTTYYNFAPRLGIAVVLRNQPGRETVFRTGGGVYFDTGQDFTALFGRSGYGTGGLYEYVSTSASPVAFPLTPAQFNVSTSLLPPYQGLTIVDRSMQLPYTFQWNASLEQALGSAQSITFSYVGSNGRRLLSRQLYSLAKANPNFTTVGVFANGLSSSYNSLQTQYKRALSRGLQVLASYTWSHAFDYQSQDANVVPYQRGNSDFDVRHNVSMALTYSLPEHLRQRWQRAAFGGWSTDLRFTTRTAFPVQLSGATGYDALGNEYYGLLNYKGTNPYLHKAGIPGGKQFNPAAFSVPLAGQTGNSARNFLRGFGENEVNLAIRREFPLHERLRLQLRAESFNLLNHPNFGAVNVTCGVTAPGAACTNPLLGQATNTLASALGGSAIGGGLSQLYQQGGPRSLQLALKLIF